jgi:predicted  nucleic acid-binding Zn-ribbon protein
MQGFRELIRFHLARMAEREAGRRQDELREEIERMDERLAGDREKLAEAQAVLEDLRKKRRVIEGEVELLERAREKYRAQLMEAKTNEVYRTLLHEIETTGARISEKETAILELMESGERAEASVQAAQAALAESEQVGREDVKRMQEDVARLEGERAAASADVARWHEAVPAALLGRYERISASREGRGMARADAQQCTECHVGIRAQVWVELVTRQELFHCPGCGRILYRAENLGAGEATGPAGGAPA